MCYDYCKIWRTEVLYFFTLRIWVLIVAFCCHHLYRLHHVTCSCLFFQDFVASNVGILFIWLVLTAVIGLDSGRDGPLVNQVVQDILLSGIGIDELALENFIRLRDGIKSLENWAQREWWVMIVAKNCMNAFTLIEVDFRKWYSQKVKPVLI